ncbi:MAG: zinc ribbon domain-containing protein [Candidatus Aminicenantes bacterium]|nr:MAG: zinc ribbon domain-containing protein [Candidatus Aminicenantes bacterium]
MSPSEENSGFCQTCGAQLFPDSNFCHQCGTLTTAKEENDAPIEKKDLKDYELYQVYSVINNFLYKGIYYDNLKINWFMIDRQEPPVPFEQAIANYKGISFASRAGPENHIKERFTREEAESLKKYLISAQKIKAVLEGYPLPVNATVKGYRDAPPPPGTDFILLHKKASYNLPFKVEGVFNTKIADERILGDDQSITVVSGISLKEVQKQLKEREKKK